LNRSSRPSDRLELVAESLAIALELGEVLTEEPDLHWAGVAGEVVDDVGKDLDELDPHARHGLLDLHAGRRR
jgi:hypothetical protein